MTVQSESALPATLRAEWPYVPCYANVNGWRMHYIDEGEGDPVVLLHGNPTWGFLYRNMIGPLVDSGRRVIVPDMIGFGLSEKPTREAAHSLDGHTANLTALMRQLDLTRITLVCHDWGGPTGLSFAMSNPARVRALTIMSTWAWPMPPAEFHTRIFPWRMMHAPLIGPYLLGNHRALAGRFKRLLPHAEGPHLVTGRHFLQEDSAPEIARLIGSFLDRLDANGGKQ